MGLLKQVDHHVGSGELASGVEVDSDELSKAGRVVVPHSFGVTPSLKDGVGLDDLVLKGGLTLLPLSGGADGGEVGDDLLGVLSLSGSRLSGNKDGLVDARVVHSLIGGLSDTEDMGPALRSPLSHVDLHGAEGVDGETLVGVDGDTEEAGVGVDQLVLVPDNRVPQDAGVTQEGEVSHVLGAVELWRVDLVNLVLLEHLDLSSNIDRDLVAILGLDKTLKVATLLLVLVRNPDRLLRVIGLSLQLELELMLDLQPGAGVRVGSGRLLNMAGHCSVLRVWESLPM